MYTRGVYFVTVRIKNKFVSGIAWHCAKHFLSRQKNDVAQKSWV